MNMNILNKIPKSGLMPLGAVIGDICGSKYEGRRKGIKFKPNTLIDPDCRFTDDTVMTIACANGLMDGIKLVNRDELPYSNNQQKIMINKIVEYIRKFSLKYPDAGYGGGFVKWVIAGGNVPYRSYGNGSAMRCSYAGWLAASVEEAKLLGRLTAEPTHNHPLGIKGAEIVAAMIYELRQGCEKESLREKYHTDDSANSLDKYNLDFTLDEIRPTYRFSSHCEGSVPQAIVAFMEGDSFEEVIKLAISIGGDSDTIAAIAASLAETIYEIPYELKECALLKLDEFLLKKMILH